MSPITDRFSLSLFRSVAHRVFIELSRFPWPRSRLPAVAFFFFSFFSTLESIMTFMTYHEASREWNVDKSFKNAAQSLHLSTKHKLRLYVMFETLLQYNSNHRE